MKRTWPTLKGRLNHPLTSRVEALKQLQITMPLSPSAQRELKRSSNGSLSGRSERQARRIGSPRKTRAAGNIAFTLTSVPVAMQQLRQLI